MKIHQLFFITVCTSVLMCCSVNNRKQLAAHSAETDEKLEAGMKEILRGNHQEAIAILQEGLQNNPRSPEAYHFGLANAYYYLFDYKTSKREIKQVLQLDQKYGDAYWLLARIYSKEGDFNKALENYNLAIHLNRNAMLLSSRGLTHIRLKNYEAALEDLNAAIELNKYDPYALSNRGLVKIKIGLYESAGQDLKQSLLINPENPYVHKHFALLHLAKKDTAAACTYFKISKNKGYASFGNEVDKHEVDSLIQRLCFD